MKLLNCILFIFFNCFTLNAAYPGQNIAGEFKNPIMRQFDFWIGEWRVENYFRQDNNTWKHESQAHLKVWPVLDGKAILEFWDGIGNKNRITKGFSIRYYDLKKQKWVACLNWPGPDNGGFFLLQGNFHFNRCEIFSTNKNQQGQSILNRYTFCDITDSTYRWHSNSSLDSGSTWQSNWIMENHRINEIPDWPSVSDTFLTYDNESFCQTKQSKLFHSLQGKWTGTMQDSSKQLVTTTEIQVNFWKVHNGVSMFYNLVAKNGYKEIGMLTYRSQNNAWLSMRLGNRLESEIITQFCKSDAPSIRFIEYSQLEMKPTTEITRIEFDKDKTASFLRHTIIDKTKEKISSQIITLSKQN